MFDYDSDGNSDINDNDIDFDVRCVIFLCVTLYHFI